MTPRCRTCRSPCCRGPGRANHRPGTVAVVGLGPGDTDWMTPQSRHELAAATDLIGYGPYLDRVRPRDGQRLHPSDNTDEPARARLACSLAEEGRAVAVVSSGDPGVFAMATAVLEEAKQWPGVAVRVIPAMTAAQAVASRVGAPLGHDYAVISLSDRLKPWDVIVDPAHLCRRSGTSHRFVQIA